MNPITLTPSAVAQVKTLQAKRGDPDLLLRLALHGGGCAGFQYVFSFDKTTTADDHIFETDGVRLVVDKASLDLLAGAQVDYVAELIGAAFVVKNPNAAGSCGCGSSFSVE